MPSEMNAPQLQHEPVDVNDATAEVVAEVLVNAATKEKSTTTATAEACTNDTNRRGRDRRNPKHRTNTNTHTRFSDFGTATDEEFRRILKERLNENPLAKDYPELFDRAPDCFVQWRNRYSASNPRLWKRLFSTDKILKEFFEAVPVLDAVIKMIDTDTRLESSQQSYTIIDMCSGKGYMGMILSELLPPSKVFRIVLMDKAWPMRNSPVKPQHINWEHIYGTFDECVVINEKHDNNDNANNDETKTDDSIGEVEGPDTDADATAGRGPGTTATPASRSYYETWPIPIDTSKQDLKSSRQLQQIRKHYLSNPSEHPVILLAIHLCGTLSLRAIELFNTNPTVKFLALKPCCLPGMIHAKRHEVFRIGTHAFDAAEVCVHGKWKKNKWENGPPRSHLQPKFQKWSDHLYKGIGMGYDLGTAADTTDAATTNTNDIEQRPNSEDEGTFPSGGATPPQNQTQEDESSSTAAAAAPIAAPSTSSLPTTRHELRDESDETIRKVHARIRVQHDGGFQNDFLFAERTPISSAAVWKGLDQCSFAAD